MIAFVNKYSMNKPEYGIIFGGEWNGYVAVPPTNKFWGKSDTDLCDSINVHGGVTFSSPAVKNGKRIIEGFKNVDFCTKNTVIPDDWWVIGFDTKHDGDSPEKWTKEATIYETYELFEQLRDGEKH